MKLAPLLVMASCLVCACSELRVQVGIMNPEIIRERATADRLAKTMPGVMAETSTSVKQFFADRINIHGKAYDTIRQAYDEESKKHPKDENGENNFTIAAKSNVITKQIRQDYDFWEMRALAATKSLQDTWPTYKAEADPVTRTRLQNSLIAALDELEAVHDAVDQLLVDDLDLANLTDRVAELPLAQRELIIKKIQSTARTEVQAQTTQLFDPGNIQHSPYAYYVAKAPPTDWAEEFDKSFGHATFGNSDIAIKALGPGNFTIKGVTFNPADVAAMAAKVTSQTVLLAAQVAGVPVKLSGTPDATKPGAALAKSSEAVSQALAKTDRVDAQLIAHRDALRRIAAALVRERDIVLNGTDAERKAALDSIKAVYESHAARLRVSAD